MEELKMKKNLFSLLFLWIPVSLMAQGYVDDIYYSSKDQAADKAAAAAALKANNEKKLSLPPWRRKLPE